MNLHVSLMEVAISQARQSLPLAGINPAVGAVLARNGQVLGKGFHRGPGTAHAEIAALHDAEQNSGNPDIARGADLYCTLEPCCHEGHGKRTPPCTRALIAAGVARVFVACRDPNPLVAGRGIAALREAGIEVVEDLCATEAAPLIESFAISIRERRPFVRLKWAQSLDGNIASASGVSKWITPEPARAEAHSLRAIHDAVLVGSGTLSADDPELTVRLSSGRNPLRVVLAGHHSLPEHAKILEGALKAGTLVLAVPGSLAAAQCKKLGVRCIELAELADVTGAGQHRDELGEPGATRDQAAGRPAVASALAALYAGGIGTVLVEGGAEVLSSFVRSGLWDAATIFVAPILLGQGLSVLGNLGIGSPDEAERLELIGQRQEPGYVRLDLRRKENICLPVL